MKHVSLLQVDPAASKHELLKSKTEIRLKKSDAIKWPTLEKSNQKADPYAKAPTAVPTPPVQQPKPAYPSSFNKRTVDWYAAVTDVSAAVVLSKGLRMNRMQCLQGNAVSCCLNVAYLALWFCCYLKLANTACSQHLVHRTPFLLSRAC